MTLCRFLLRSLRRYSTTNPFQTPISATTSSAAAEVLNPNFDSQHTTTNGFQSPNTGFTTATGPLSHNLPPPPTPTPSAPYRPYSFSSAEEAAAERRRRKRRLRIEPPLYALRPNPASHSSHINNPDKPRLPDSTSALVGPRLNLHNRVQSLIRAGDLDSASYVARQSVFQSIRPTVFTCNAIIAAMYRAKRYQDAKALFQYFFNQFNIIPNIVSYNNLIVSHCESNEVEDALKVYNHILENAPYSPSAVTYRHLTKGLIDAGRIDDAANLLKEMLHKGHGADSLVFNNLILGFLNVGNLEKANELFDELKGRCTVYDGVVNATFMDWFFNQGKPKEAMESYRDLMGRNYRMVPATQNVLLETLLRHGEKQEAWKLFHDMLDDHTPPTFQAVNSDTINMMVNECFKEGKITEAIDVFKRTGKAEKSKPFMMDVAGFNNMITRLCELGMMEEAEQYYQALCNKSLAPDVNTYRTLIDAYINVDNIENMLEKYSTMVEAGLRVIPAYANKWFGFMIEKGKVLDCVSILSKMCDREPRPDVTTYDIIIRGLIECDNYDAAANLLSQMMNYSVGTTVTLKEFVLDVFTKQGRQAEIENILYRSRSPFPAHRPYTGPRGPPGIERAPQMPQQGGRHTAMPWQTEFYPHTHNTSQMTRQSAHIHPRSEQEAEFGRVAGQSAS
ncbi:pentatricopeptide repeat-containing At1g10270-like [Olea europaea subsp. europaea]|uniref:Pentatricopeptide repeat-containing At1g10270-like n=1 Tax=Olea europaea subsp. europaea TaxID=158383 RepID=A0A8S0Q9M0_OLEEU|nr:pentatricopeptide repeat-containing At1g10270-like [Olea europaea subsp. europaea]